MSSNIFGLLFFQFVVQLHQSNNASICDLQTFLVDRDAFFRPNENRHIWVIKAIARTLRYMQHNPHKLWSENDDFHYAISWHGKIITLHAHCDLFAQNVTYAMHKTRMLFTLRLNELYRFLKSYEKAFACRCMS